MYRDNKSGEYPLYRREVQERRPNVSLPDGEWAKQVLDFIDVSFVRPTSCPPYEPGTQMCVEDTPIEMYPGVWAQQWRIVDNVSE